MLPSELLVIVYISGIEVVRGAWVMPIVADI